MTDVSVDHQTTSNGPVATSPKAVEDKPSSAETFAPSVPDRSASTPTPTSDVEGRIDIADEVVEKIAGLAAYEVDGVADLGGDTERTLESARERVGVTQKRGDQGVKAKITNREVTVDVTVMVEYGHVIMEVAQRVQTNVATQTHRMLGLRVLEVNVNVDDVLLPTAVHPDGRREETGDDVSFDG